MPLRLAVGAAVVATGDGHPSAIVGLIIPIDDDLLYNTRATITLAAKVARAIGKTGEAVVFLQPFTELDPGDTFDPETPDSPEELDP